MPKLKVPKVIKFSDISKPCYQTELPDRSILIGQKLVENGKVEKLKWDILGGFQTMWWN